MSNKNLQRIQKMIRKAQKSLHLSSYRIKSQIHNIESSDYAEIVYKHPNKTATIKFNKRKIDDELKNTIIHELLHLFLDRHLGVAENVFKRQKKYSSLKKYQKGEEKTISILASLLEEVIFER